MPRPSIKVIFSRFYGVIRFPSAEIAGDVRDRLLPPQARERLKKFLQQLASNGRMKPRLPTIHLVNGLHQLFWT
jgi:hypothetical protein